MCTSSDKYCKQKYHLCQHMSSKKLQGVHVCCKMECMLMCISCIKICRYDMTLYTLEKSNVESMNVHEYIICHSLFILHEKLLDNDFTSFIEGKKEWLTVWLLYYQPTPKWTTGCYSYKYFNHRQLALIQKY